VSERRGRSAAELARRWRTPEPKVLEILWGLRDAGLADESQGLWVASPRALREYGWMTGYGIERERERA
jgi:hypothetical protein